MVLQPATNAAGAADDPVTALARAKLAEFQRSKGIENPKTLEDVKASHHKLYNSLLAEAAAEVEGSKENVHPNTPMRPPPPASAPSPAPAPRRKLPAPRRQEPAAKKKPTPPDQDDEPELTDDQLEAVHEAILKSDPGTSTKKVIQRKAESILGLERDALKPKRAAIKSFMTEYAAFLETPDDDLMTLALGKWILMQLKSGVTEDNLTTLEDLQASDSRTYVRILAEVMNEHGCKEDAVGLAELAPRAQNATASLRATTQLVCYREVDSDEDLGEEDDEFEPEGGDGAFGEGSTKKPAAKKRKKKEPSRPPTKKAKKKKTKKKVPSRRRNRGASIQACHAVDATSSP